jgi:predicted amidohydrolase
MRGILPARRLTRQSTAEESVPMVIRAAAVQLNAQGDADRNLATADRLVRAAAADGAQLVVLPEKWPALGPGEVLQANAQPLDGPAMTWARAVAAELRVDLVAGSFSERVDGQERLSNTSAHVGPDGTIRALYRKVHMFDVEVDGTVYRESDHEQGGTELVVTRAAGAEVGMSVCYDLRFPELYRALAVAGARILVVPAAFTLATTREHWEPLLRARAIEDQCFVIAANQIGEHAPGLRSGGRSMIVDPWGVVLATAPDTETYVIADLDLDHQAAIRDRLPSLANRRPDVYAAVPAVPAAEVGA